MDSPIKIVVDVGNTRAKWGLCNAAAVADIAALPSNDITSWQRQLAAWQLNGPLHWTVSGVDPPGRDKFIDWLRQRGDAILPLTSYEQLPLEVALPFPAKVGIDRLLNAVAVNTRRAPQSAAIIMDAGSAVTVDYVDRTGAFRGGAIFPGLRLMAKALHEYTALLPLVEVDADIAVPGTSTVDAMKAGIFCAAIGGIREFVARLEQSTMLGEKWEFFAGGGDAPLVAGHLPFSAILWPEMTLEGMRLS